ncbi:MAG TPA: hypothetical protein VN694_10880 [Caulobacteraceae bacterium]|nr:hypothetical protein [Caulobacteraceae bacterium]
MSSEPASPSPQPDGEVSYHNSVLTRSHEPPRSGNHSWLMIIPLVVVIIAGAAFWVYVNGHPAGPIVNHAVAAASDKPAWQ